MHNFCMGGVAHAKVYELGQAKSLVADRFPPFSLNLSKIVVNDESVVLGKAAELTVNLPKFDALFSEYISGGFNATLFHGLVLLTVLP